MASGGQPEDDKTFSSPIGGKRSVAMFTPEGWKRPTLSPHLVTDRITRCASPMRDTQPSSDVTVRYQNYSPSSGWKSSDRLYREYSPGLKPSPPRVKDDSSIASYCSTSRKIDISSAPFDRRHNPKFATTPPGNRILTKENIWRDGPENRGQRLPTSTSIETSDSVFTPGTPKSVEFASHSGKSHSGSQNEFVSGSSERAASDVRNSRESIESDTKPEIHMVIHKSYDHMICFDLKKLLKDQKRGRLPRADENTVAIMTELCKSLETPDTFEVDPSMLQKQKPPRSFTSSLSRLVRNLRGHGRKEKTEKKKKKHMSRSADLLGETSYVESSTIEVSDYPSATSETSADFELQAQIATLSSPGGVSSGSQAYQHASPQGVGTSNAGAQYTTLPSEAVRKLKAMEGFSGVDNTVYKSFKEKQLAGAKREGAKPGAPLSTPTHSAEAKPVPTLENQTSCDVSTKNGISSHLDQEEHTGSHPDLEKHTGSNGVHSGSVHVDNPGSFTDVHNTSGVGIESPSFEEVTRKPPSYVKLSCSASGYSSGYSYPSSPKSHSPLVSNLVPPLDPKPTGDEADKDDPRLKDYIPYGKNFVKGISQKFEQLGTSSSSPDSSRTKSSQDVSPGKVNLANLASSPTRLSDQRTLGSKSQEDMGASHESSPESGAAGVHNSYSLPMTLTSTPAEKGQGRSEDQATKNRTSSPGQTHDARVASMNNNNALLLLNGANKDEEESNLVSVTGLEGEEQVEEGMNHTNFSSSCSEDTLSIGKSLTSSAGSLDYLESETKDGQYYLNITDREEERFCALCKQAEEDLRLVVSEEICGKLRAAIGKTQLVTSQKFKQFRGLCQQNISPAEDQRVTTCEDLGGFWDMIQIQLEELDNVFLEVQLLRENGWKKLDPDALPPPRSRSHPNTPRASRGHRTPKSTPSAGRSARSKESRKRLMEAKRAARERMQQAQASDGTDGCDVVILDGAGKNSKS